MTTHDESPIIRTTTKRMAQGLAIIVIVMAVAAAIGIPNWHNFAKNPPPVSTIMTKTTATGGGGGGEGASTTTGGGATQNAQPTTLPPGTTAITILTGASVQGNPAYNPSDGKVPLNSKIVWQNKDNTVHTATSGSGPSDANSGKIFDTKMLNAGASSTPQELTGAKVGDTVPYYCQIHPYMTAKLTVTAASSTSGGGGGGAGSAGPTASTAATGAAATGPVLTIPEGASVQGNPAYKPDPMTAKKGDTIQVENKDTTLHTVTSGKTLEDPNKGKMFDSSMINPGATAKISTASLNPGEYPFHCDVHPYMIGTLKVQ
jgi:plastocyanin